MKYWSLFLATIIVISCTDDFEEINTNSNAPTDVESSLLLRQVIYDYGEQMSYEGFVAGNLLAQHLTALDFNLFDRHALKSPQLGGDPWPIFYKNLRDNEIILEKSINNPADAVYEGPARIMKAYITGALTDLFGNVPYSEAFKGNGGNVTPAYDLQEDIYLSENGILDNLDKGIEAIESYQGSIDLEGDLFYNGDLNGWLRLANSLKIKFLMRISDKVDVSADLQQLIDEDFYIKENEQNAIFNFTDGEPNNFRLARLRAGDFNNFVMSETAEDLLTDLNDQRVNVLYRTFSNAMPTGPQFNGLINGIDASQTTISLSDYSLAGSIFREETGRLDANYMTAWETNFWLAEAAQRGLISGDAKSFYDAGVALAFEYWNTELPSDYLSNEAAYNSNGTDPIEQIITQKWIASMINGYEGWIEYRRTGFPELKEVDASLNMGLIPVRLPYPTEEAALNTDNYNTAASMTDDNSINSPVWWDQ